MDWAGQLRRLLIGTPYRPIDGVVHTNCFWHDLVDAKQGRFLIQADRHSGVPMEVSVEKQRVNNRRTMHVDPIQVGQSSLGQDNNSDSKVIPLYRLSRLP